MKRVFAASSACIAFCCFQYANEAGFKTEVSENFETNTGMLASAKYNEAEVKILSDAESPLGTGKSLVLDTRNRINVDWPRSVRFDNFLEESGVLCKVEFDAFAMEGNKKGKSSNYVILDYTEAGKTVRSAAVIFGERVGAKTRVSCTGYFPDNSASHTISFTSEKGSKIAIDNIVVSTKKFPQEYDWIFKRDAFVGMKVPPSNLGYFSAGEPFAKLGKNEFFPFIDKYGQFKHRSWKGKICDDSDFAKRLAEEKKFNESHPAVKNRDTYFGLSDPTKKFDASGRFRTRKIDGKWFLITPDGNLFWSLGIDCAGIGASTPTTDREFYFDDISEKKYIGRSSGGKFFYNRPHKVFNFGMSNFEKKYGDYKKADIAALCAERMRAWGLNTYGAWTQADILSAEKIPFAYIINSEKPAKLESKKSLTAYWQPFPDYFDPRFETLTKKKIEKSAAFLNSKMCIGVFVDNELPWQNDDLRTARAVLACPETQFSKIEFQKILRKKYRDVERLNAAWNSNYSSWDDFLKTDGFSPSGSAANTDMLDFEKHIYARYFSVCRDAVKSVSADVLYFGCRLAWTNPTCTAYAAKYCDAVSLNLYRNDVSGYKLPEGCDDKPIIVGEFHFGNRDAGVFGGGLRPRATRADKKIAYEKYVISALENPNVIGVHWFQWRDQPATGRGDGENYSIGFVDICDTPHYEMAKASRRLSKKMYSVRLESSGEQKVNTEKTTTY